MKVAVATTLTISDETNPTDIRFSTGAKTFTDSTSYQESEASTFSLATGDSDVALPLGSMSLISVLYLLAKTAGIKVKVFTGVGEESPSEMELIPNCPCILPVKCVNVTVSNTSGSATTLVYAAAGN